MARLNNIWLMFGSAQRQQHRSPTQGKEEQGTQHGRQAISRQSPQGGQSGGKNSASWKS
jgi:hypothetical protein